MKAFWCARGAGGGHLIILIALLVTIASGAWSTPALADEPVKVAFIGPLTGANAAVGQGIRNSFKLAIDHGNRGGTLSGHRLPDGVRVEVVVLDDEGVPASGVAAAKKVIADRRVVAVSAHWNSPVALATNPLWHEGRLLNVIPGTLAGKITAPGYPEVARLPVLDIAQSKGAAVFTVKNLRVRKAAVLWDRTGFGEVLSTAYIDNFKRLGGEVVLYDGFNVGEKDFKPLLTRIKGLDPGIIFCGCLYTEGALLKKQMYELQMSQKLMGSSGIDTPTFFKVAGNTEGEGTYAVRVNDPVEQLPGGKKFISAYERAGFAEPYETWGPHGYVAGEVIVYLIGKYGTKRTALIEGIRKITRLKPVQTIFGPIWFDDHGQMHPMVLNMVEGKNGAFVPVQRLDVTD